MRVRPGAVGAVAACAALAALMTGCRNDAVPAWGYPELRTTLRSLSAVLEEGCDETAPASCAKHLDRLDALAERAFTQVLDHKLLDGGYVAALNELDDARARRAAAAGQAPSRHDPHHLPFRRAVQAERRAYEHLLAELERLRTAPPPGDGTEPV
ncbi:hypothetical protein ACIGFK_17855 [Streptomyces sp. NPDC085524]|uniref:hypothetical protein n=1 Tax=unclassified Streptomyces TaxID=2593676 RepID=UPI0035DDE2AB